MKATLMQMQTWISGARTTGDADIVGLSTDSRNVAVGSLFVALRGERFDAHDFLQQAIENGAAAVMVERMPDGLAVPALVVPDTRVALCEIARAWRHQFEMPLIGVTGSNGKTTVKEMIAAVLRAAFGEEGYLATRGNLNNEIGVPLTLSRLAAAHRAAVVELGMNHVGEITLLASMAQPTVGLVNNAQREHQEFMHSVEAVARENGCVIEALPEDGVAVFPVDDDYAPIWRALAEAKGRRTVVTFGMADNADVTCSVRAGDFGSDMTLDVQGRKASVTLSAAGLHNVRNALAATACCVAIGLPIETIVAGLESFAPVSGRMQKKSAANGAVVIDDTYNANPDSVLAALNVLAQAPSPRIMVLGDMGEVGQEGVSFHEEAGSQAARLGIDCLYTHGDLARHAATAFGAKAKHFEDMESLVQSLLDVMTENATVLVKGSRFMRMERVIDRLVNEKTGEAH